jgi:hypothetical protein
VSNDEVSELQNQIFEILRKAKWWNCF